MIPWYWIPITLIFGAVCGAFLMGLVAACRNVDDDEE